jgi:hypothetical protein
MRKFKVKLWAQTAFTEPSQVVVVDVKGVTGYRIETDGALTFYVDVEGVHNMPVRSFSSWLEVWEVA